jgi:hypothetical protein
MSAWAAGLPARTSTLTCDDDDDDDTAVDSDTLWVISVPSIRGVDSCCTAGVAKRQQTINQSSTHGCTHARTG